MLLEPGGLLAWIAVGLIAGWLAGITTRGRGFGVIGDLMLGLIGALFGGFVAALVLPGEAMGLLESIVVAFIGSVILLWLVRVVTGARRIAT
jgi:uncharacterized membrane protein YeaQ/YmgE (transglycosylase-associated protein family)